MIEGFKEAVVVSGASMSKDPELRREIKKVIVEALKGKRAMREPVPDYWNRIKVVNGCAATSHGTRVAYIIQLMAAGWTIERLVERFKGLTDQDCYDALAWAGDRIG